MQTDPTLSREKCVRCGTIDFILPLFNIVDFVPVGANGYIIHEKRIDGKLHCEDGPAVIITGYSNNIVEMSWWVNGALHNENNWAKITISDHTITLAKYVNGSLSSNTSPALVTIDKSGRVVASTWFKDDIEHTSKPEVPSFVSYYPSGAPHMKRYMTDGILYRDPRKGAACVVWSEAGEIEYMTYSKLKPVLPTT